MRKLEGRAALVTVGSRGIGRAIVELFLAEGARVMSCDKDAAAGALALSEVRARFGHDAPIAFCHADLGNIEQIEGCVREAIGQMGAPTILVNNAASNFQRHTAETTLDEFAATMDVNVRGYWYLARLLHPHMARGRSGSIVNIASTQAYQTHKASFPYNVSKGAVLALTRAMAVDFGPDGIRVNSILPGFVATKLSRDWVGRFDDPERKWREIMEAHPLGRIPTVDEVAKAALFLAGDDSSGVSGVELLVDCGRQAQRR
jgi:NAD(P)-dependent dehydrogenase (short-subunit alcohol dehydrogenase family)